MQALLVSARKSGLLASLHGAKRSSGHNLIKAGRSRPLTSMARLGNIELQTIGRSGSARRLVLNGAPSMKRRHFCTALEEDDDLDSAEAAYTEEDLLDKTIEANGFRIEADTEVSVDIKHWEHQVQKAFNELRHGDVVTAYQNIRGMGPKAAHMSDLHVASLDAIGYREDDILTAYQDMRQAGVKILSNTYGKVMKALYSKNDPNKITSLFQVMQSEGTPGTSEVYTILLKIYYDLNPKDVGTVIGILKTMKSLKVPVDIAVLNRALLCFCEAERRDLIIAAYDEHVIKGQVQPKRITKAIMIETMLLEGRTAEAEAFLASLTKDRQFPRLRTYELLIDSFLSRGMKAKADDLLNEMVHAAHYKPSKSIFKSFFAFFEKLESYEGLSETLARMVREKVAPDAAMFESMLMVYYKHNRTEEFLATFIEMLDRQMIPARPFWTRRLKMLILGEMCDLRTILNEYEYMLQTGHTPTEEELRLIMAQLYKFKRPDLATQFAKEEFATHNVKLDATDYSLLMRAWEQRMDNEQVLQTYQQFVTAGVADSEPHVIMFQNLIKWGEVTEAMKILDTIQKSVASGKLTLDADQVPRIMESFAHMGEDGIALMQQVYDLALQHARDTVTVDVFSLLISQMTKSFKIESALSYFRAMQDEFKLIPTPAIYQTVLEGIASMTEKEQSTKWHSTMFETFREAVLVPISSQTISVKLFSTFCLFFMRHGNQEGFSHAIAWYKVINKEQQGNLHLNTNAALRKWLRTLPSSSCFTPEKYTARDLSILLSAHAPTQHELDMQVTPF